MILPKYNKKVKCIVRKDYSWDVFVTEFTLTKSNNWVFNDGCVLKDGYKVVYWEYI
jgi:hypothetical protein